jgi:hypothetical protein
MQQHFDGCLPCLFYLLPVFSLHGSDHLRYA